jgi:uncharacterized protein YkwD
VAECTVCGDPVAVSDACPHCARPVCERHRAAHDCPGVESDSATWYTDPDAGRPRATGGRDLSNPRRLATGVAVAVAVALVVALALSITGGATGFDDERVERLVVSEVNDARADRGLAPLDANATLARVADAHSGDMAARGYVNHTAPNGSTVADRYDRFGLDCAGSENIYFTPNGELSVTERAFARRVVEEWIASPGHRETLLDPDFSRQGVGIAVGTDGGVYVTQNIC